MSSISFSSSPYASLEEWFGFLGLSLLFFIGANLKINEQKFKHLTWIIIGAASVLSFIGLLIYTTGLYNRLTSVFYWPNPFATFLLLAIPLSYYWIYIDTSRLKIFSLPILILLVTSLILTGSRGALIALGIGSIFILIRDFKVIRQNIFKIILILLIIFCSVISVNYLRSDHNAFLKRASSNGELDVSSSIRLDYWYGAIQIFKDNFLFGSGLDTFKNIYPTYQKSPLSSGIYPHNLYLEILAEGGVFSFVVFLSFLFFILMGSLKNLKNNLIIFALLLSTIFYLAHNALDIGSHYFAYNLLFWFLLGVLVNINNKENNSNEMKEDVKNNFNFIIFLLSIILIIYQLLLLNHKYYLYTAEQLEEKNNYEETGANYLKSIRFIKSPEALMGLGKNYFIQSIYGGDQNKLLSSSLIVADNLIKIDCRSSANYELRGKVYESLGYFDKAIVDYKKTIALDRFNPRYYINLVDLLIKNRNYKDAGLYLNIILSSYPKEVVERKKMLIMESQTMTSGIEYEMDLLYRLEDKLKYYEKNK
ncbi:MAG: O-antigen ligase family protein [Candidatus Falkowbacteria bacterium]|nr:O-antigen ligase family protein [Candidatus Falkowbacteria bacterium]